MFTKPNAKKLNTTACVFAVAAAGAAASAMPAGAQSPGSIFIAEDALVTLTFESSSAGWSGNLHHIQVAGDSSRAGMGPALLNNHSASRGDTVSLGLVPGSTNLMFAYDVVTGRRNTFRMDDATSDMFAVRQDDANTWTLFVEDWVNGDDDYNDAVFTVEASPVPAPAALATAGLALAGTGARRRRNG